MSIPVIDLFAGPGGLSEGFSQNGFNVRLSIECNRYAHQTLLFRSFYRKLIKSNDNLSVLHKYFKNQFSEKELYSTHEAIYNEADNEVWCAELGKVPDIVVDKRIRKALGKEKNGVLEGGPPCQAYSLAGRSRMKGTHPEFEDDHRHFLYKQYLRIVGKHAPAIFVMENVKGILSASVKKVGIFQQILKDLENPNKSLDPSIRANRKLRYTLHPIVMPEVEGQLELECYPPSDFIVNSEKFGIPQKRHRVFIVGIREGSGITMSHLTPSKEEQLTVWKAIGDLPGLRSGLTRKSLGDWNESIQQITNSEWLNKLRETDFELFRELTKQLKSLRKIQKNGESIVSRSGNKHPGALEKWYRGSDLPFLFNHVCRDHMDRDLQRYFYAACHSLVHNRSPKIRDFPKELWPKHKNVQNSKGKVIFDDRFRVQ
ncbi:MAG: DNA cytosine methyltransferase, partial [Flavobacteriaceae bacterium]